MVGGVAGGLLGSTLGKGTVGRLLAEPGFDKRVDHHDLGGNHRLSGGQI